MKPSVSVVISAYNKRPYIARAVRSVLRQTVRDFELIVVDDGSTDGTSAELEGFRSDPRLRVIRQDNAGASAARNRGLEASRSALCAFMDADDAFLPEHLESLLKLAEQYPSAGLLGTAYYNVFPDGSHVARTVPGERFSILPDYFDTSRGCGFLPLNTSSAAVRREAFERVGGFLDSVAIGEDVEYWARVALQFPVAYDAAPSALYYLWTPASAMTAYQWKPDVPPVVGTVSRHGDPNASAIDYAAWIMLKHAACGIVAGDRMGARRLLGHPLLAESSLRRRRALLWTATFAPAPMLAAYLKWRNWQHARSKHRGEQELLANSMAETA